MAIDKKYIRKILDIRYILKLDNMINSKDKNNTLAKGQVERY